MKAISEGTATELALFFRIGTPEDIEQVCMFCGCSDYDPCPGGCTWAAPNVCSRCAEKINEKKPAKKHSKPVLKEPDQVTPGKVTPGKVSIDNLLIPAFDHDRELKSSYKTLFFTESDDGKVVLSYNGTKLYTTREKALQIPYPIPRGYFSPTKSGTPSNRVTAIRSYRAYLAEHAPSPHPDVSDTPVTPNVSSTEPIFLQNHFTEAEKFDYSKLPKDNVGSSRFYDNGDGRIVIENREHGDIVFVTKEQIAVLMKMDKDTLNEYIGDLNHVKRYILKKHIENLKDEEIGALGMVKTDTRPPKE